MKILVIADTHIGKFDKKKYLFLQRIISKCDRLIINGDFIDTWVITAEQFLESPWKGLFPILLEKKTVYIKGNHEKNIAEDIARNFSVKFCNKHEEIINGEKFVFEHGDQILKEMEGIILKLYRRILGLKLKRLLFVLSAFLSAVYKVFPKITQNTICGRKRNNLLKDSIKDRNFFLVASDTHTHQKLISRINLQIQAE